MFGKPDYIVYLADEIIERSKGSIFSPIEMVPIIIDEISSYDINNIYDNSKKTQKFTKQIVNMAKKNDHVISDPIVLCRNIIKKLLLDELQSGKWNY